MLDDADSDVPDLRDRVRLYMEQNQMFDLSMRVSFVPEDVLRKLLNKTAVEAEIILSAHGY